VEINQLVNLFDVKMSRLLQSDLQLETTVQILNPIKFCLSYSPSDSLKALIQEYIAKEHKDYLDQVQSVQPTKLVKPISEEEQLK
jgi:signal recognition particle GTPase